MKMLPLKIYFCMLDSLHVAHKMKFAVLEPITSNKKGLDSFAFVGRKYFQKYLIVRWNTHPMSYQTVYEKEEIRSNFCSNLFIEKNRVCSGWQSLSHSKKKIKK